jgi:hypothetical protein
MADGLLSGFFNAGGPMPAALIDGNQFVLAAQKYGLGTDMATMNKMVGLVNSGLTVDAAAQAVSGNGAGLLAPGAGNP